MAEKMDILLECLDIMAESKDTRPTGIVAFEAATEIRRLLAGDFTPEEIHNFCHKIPSTVPLEEFQSGCAAYQRQIYGKQP